MRSQLLVLLAALLSERANENYRADIVTASAARNTWYTHTRSGSQMFAVGHVGVEHCV